MLVKGGYTPDTVIVLHGKPVRINFRREEAVGCSDKVIFADFQKSADLPTGELVRRADAQGGRRIRLRLSHGYVPWPIDRRMT
jgi:hypothetical protein